MSIRGSHSIARAASAARVICIGAFVVLTITGCSSSGDSTSPSASPAVESQRAPPVPTNRDATDASGIREEVKRLSPLDEYKRLAAERILDSSRSEVMSGAPQALLRAVIVVKLHVRDNGQVTTEILRGRDSVFAQHALGTIRRASPLPVPPKSIASDIAAHGYTETWLYNSDGRFHLRTLAPPQLTE